MVTLSPMATAPPPPSTNSEVTVVGAPPARLRDAYHRALSMPWTRVLGLAVGGYLLLNLLFALVYRAVGGVAGVRPGYLRDYFYFSVHTMGTIGYGSMYPNSDAAHVLVIVEALVGLLVTALVTGLVFARFSQSAARIVFSRNVTIGPMDGVPTLAFRISNERGNQIVEATLRVVLIRTERTREGMVFYRMLDLPLQRDRSPAFSRSWMALHTIDAKSPLHGVSPEKLLEWEAELLATVVGTDDTSLQPVHARQRYQHADILWGVRLADILSEREDGSLLLDLRRFHETVPVESAPDEGASG